MSRALEALRSSLRSSELCIVNRNNRQLFSTYSRRENDLYELVGYEGSSGLLLVRPQEVTLLVDSRYLQQCQVQFGPESEAHRRLGLKYNLVVEAKEGWQERKLISWAERYRGRGGGRVLVDHSRWSAMELQEMKKLCSEVAWCDRDFSIASSSLAASALSAPVAVSTFSAPVKVDALCASEPSWSFAEKCRLLRSKMSHADLHVVTCPDDVAWLLDLRANDFDFRRSVDGVVLLSKSELFLFKDLDATSKQSLERERPALVVIPKRSAWVQGLKTLFQKREWRTHVPFHHRPGAINARDHEGLMSVLQGRPLFRLKRSLLELGRLEKRDEELRIMEAAQGKLKAVMEQTVDFMKCEMKASRPCRESEVLERAHAFAAELGGHRQSFPGIVASGEHSRFPHHQPTRKLIKADEMVLLDLGYYFGAGDYATDMSRTVFAGPEGKAHAVQREMYTRVLVAFLRQKAQRFEEGELKAHVLDKVARAYLASCEEQGFYFSHSTGHGVGISDHELGITIGPSSRLSLRPGYTYSLEPGLYRRSVSPLSFLNFGVRIEDVVSVVKDRELCIQKSLSHASLDESLIDRSLMDDSDLESLEDYWRHI